MTCDDVFDILTRGPFPSALRKTNRSNAIWRTARNVGAWRRRYVPRSSYFRSRSILMKPRACQVIAVALRYRARTTYCNIAKS